MTERHAANEALFRDLYAKYREAVLAYLLRRVPTAEDAADALAETYLVLWRRIDDVPTGEDAKLWLFGVARNMLLRGGDQRRRDGQLVARIGETAESLRPPLPEPAFDDDLVSALRTLSRDDQEILTLCAWEELTPSEAAAVLSISANAARIRLHRARRRLIDRLAAEVPTTSSPARLVEW